MTFQTNKNDPCNRGRSELDELLCSIWLGWRDLNPRILVPETSALPLGDIPIRYIL